MVWTRLAGAGAARLCIAALLVADEHEGYAVDGAQAADDGRVVQAGAVAVQLHEFVRDVERNVQERGPIGVPRDLQPLRGRQALVRVLAQLPRRAARRGQAAWLA